MEKELKEFNKFKYLGSTVCGSSEVEVEARMRVGYRKVHSIAARLNARPKNIVF